METVTSYNYLGVTLDDKLNFEAHINNQIRKANKRLYFVRNMNKLKVQINIIHLFYNTIISSELTVWTKKVLNNHTHPLYSEFVFMPSGRHLSANKCRTERLNRSAVPAAIGLYNAQYT